jgi:hypothetical protein
MTLAIENDATLVAALQQRRRADTGSATADARAQPGSRG